MKELLFKNKKVNFQKLLKFGFVKSEKDYIYKTKIFNGDFELTVAVLSDAKIRTKLVETDTGEIYTLHLVKGADGNFVGKIRDEYEKILELIAENCCDMHIFKFEQSHKIIKYINKKYEDDFEYLWEKFPNNAIARRKDNKKWYCAILTVNRQKLGFEKDEDVEVIDIRAPKEEVPNLLKSDNIYPAYHMNKNSWITVILDGSMDIQEIFALIDKSYELALK